MTRARRLRDDPAIVTLEGFHALKHALRFGASVPLALARDPEQVDALARRLAPDVRGRMTALARPVTGEAIEALVAHPPATGVIAFALRPQHAVEAVLARDRDRPVVALEHPHHLGNVGAAVRVAAAAGAAAVLTTGSRDPWSAAALRGSAGLHFALPVLHAPEIPDGPRPLIAVDPAGEPLEPDRLPPGAILAFGTEREGLSAAVRRRAHAQVAIPMRPGVSSLNLATAVAVVLYARP